MNDVCKETIADKLRQAIDSKGLKHQEVTDLFGLKSKYYVSMILSKKPEQWKKVSREAWERVRDWSNSGETIKTYSNKHNLDAKTENQSRGKSEIIIKPEGCENPESVTINLPGTNVSNVPNQKTTIIVDIIIRINGKEIHI